MKVGLLSDTHGWLDPKILDHFANCDEIWHAGDIGDANLPAAFTGIKPFRAVYGNIDTVEVRHMFPEFQEFKCEELTVWMIHIAGNPPFYTPSLRAKLQKRIPDILVCGHSHILRVMQDKQHPPLRYLNPGAAGIHGFHHMRTLLRFEINGRKIHHMEVIELGLRAALTEHH